MALHFMCPKIELATHLPIHIAVAAIVTVVVVVVVVVPNGAMRRRAINN